MAYETIKLEHDGALAILTLNRPEKMNSLSDQLLADFRAAMDACERDDSVRAPLCSWACLEKKALEQGPNPRCRHPR